MKWADGFEQQVESDLRWQHTHKRSVNLICMAPIEGDEATDRVAQQLNEEGQMSVTVTTVQGKCILRVCIGGTQTRKSHVEAAWQRIASTGAAARK